MLCAVIMLEDWNRILAEGNARVEKCAKCIDGLEQIYYSICAFTEIYKSVWSESGAGAYNGGEYHSKLVESIRALVRPLLERTGCLGEPDQSGFLSEILIHSAIRPDVKFDDIKPFIIKLL